MFGTVSYTATTITWAQAKEGNVVRNYAGQG